MQTQLFDRDAKWHLNRRVPHIVPRADNTGYVIRVRWSQKLGFQLDHVFASHRVAVETLDRIQLAGFITPINWKRFFNPKWSPKCVTLRAS